MVAGRPSRAVVGFFDAVFRPSRFVRAPNATGGDSGTFRRILSLLGVYVINVLLYAIPLTLSGLGVAAESDPPAWFIPIVARVLGDPDAAWWLFAGIGQNSVFLTLLSGLTLVTYHAALIVTRSSQGFMLTLYTVVYSVSAYLAGIFTILVFLTRAEALSTARDLVINLQLWFATEVYDTIGVPSSRRALPSGEPVQISRLSNNEAIVLAVLGMLLLYFAYSLYLGALLNHDAGATSAALSLLAVGLSPVVYVIIISLTSTGGVLA